jgi:hypothetical protein
MQKRKSEILAKRLNQGAHATESAMGSGRRLDFEILVVQGMEGVDLLHLI